MGGSEEVAETRGQHKVAGETNAGLERPPERNCFSDANTVAVRGVCTETRTWWRFDIPADTPPQGCGQVRRDHGGMDAPTISINLLKLLGIQESGYVMYFQQDEQFMEDGHLVMLRGDNITAVS